MDATPTPVHREIRLERLRAFHGAVVQALGEKGLGGTRLGELLARDVAARCVQCGFQVTGEELSAAFAAEAAHTAANPKHARLLQHYCARNGCASYFYRFEFQANSDVDWTPLLARADALIAGAEKQATEEQTAAQKVATLRRRKQIGIAAAIVAGIVLLSLARQWWVTGTLPGTTPPPKYQIDPQSLPPQPSPR